MANPLDAAVSALKALSQADLVAFVTVLEDHPLTYPAFEAFIQLALTDLAAAQNLFLSLTLQSRDPSREEAAARAERIRKDAERILRERDLLERRWAK